MSALTIGAEPAGIVAGTIISVLSASGYLGVFLLMALESACIPIPSEVILPFAGYLVSLGKLNLLLVATVGALGCNLGSTAAYFVGYYGGRPFVRRWGKYLLLTEHDLLRADHFFEKFGGPAVLIGRLLPVIRTFIALPAGIARMPMAKFQVYTFLGSWPWCLALAYVGVLLGDAWESNPRFHAVFRYFDYIIAIAVALLLSRFIWTRWRNRHRA